jgi:outer membrane protein TolC
MNVNVPLYQGKRDAAVCEALHRLNQERAELEQQIDNVQNEVQSAYEQFAESRRTLELYQSKILPAARQNVETARTTYTTATFDFLRLVESQRRYLMLQEKQREAEAELVRRAAELERSVGGPIELAIPTEEIPPAQP